MARYALTAGNVQPWKFLVVRDKDNKAKLKEAVKEPLSARIEGMSLTQEEKAGCLEGFCQFVERIFVAPVWVLIFADTSRYPDLVAYDGAMAAQNLMLAAYALGYGTSFQTTIFPSELVKDHFSVPDRYRFICAMPIGRPAATSETPPKKELTSFIWQEQVPEQEHK
jgi:nitroreductase